MIDPLFTESWLDGKLTEVFDAALFSLTESENSGTQTMEDMTWGFAKALSVFHYEGMSAMQIYDAIWETYINEPRPTLYDQDNDA